MRNITNSGRVFSKLSTAQTLLDLLTTPISHKQVIEAGLCLEGRADRSDGPRDIALAGLPVADGDAHAALATPGCAGEKGFTAAQDCPDDLISTPVVIDIGCAGRGV